MRIKRNPYLPILAGGLGLAVLLALARGLSFASPTALRAPNGLTAAGPGFTILAQQMHSPLALLVVLAGVFTMTQSARKVIAPRREYEQVFGPSRVRSRDPRCEPASLRSRPRLRTGLVFWTLPGTRHELLADLWQPPEGTPPSGLALIYFHGERKGLGWSSFGSGALFGRLAAQGHLVMEVAYRPYIEVDWSGRVADVRRAIAWMKANAARYGVDPNRIVLAGADCGADVALLAAYTPNHLALTPPDAEDEDSTVAAALVYYSPSVRATTSPKGLFSPLTHAHPACPPALILQPDADFIAHSRAGRSLVLRLKRAGAPVVCAAYPQFGHRLDLLVPRLSSSHQSILQEIDRFLSEIIHRENW